MKQSSTEVNFKDVFLALPERYVVFEPNPPHYTMVAADDAYLKVVGLSRDQVVGHGLFDIFPDTSPMALKTGKGELARSLENCLKTKTPDSLGVVRYDIPDQNGELALRYWQATHYPVLNEKGEVKYIVQNTMDVTELVLASEQQKFTENQFDEILATGLVGSWMWDVKSDVVQADKGLANLFGLETKEIAGGMPLDHFTNAIHPQDRERVEKEIGDVLAGADVFESEYRTLSRNGKIHWVIARGRVDRDEKGEPVSFPGVMVDITARKSAESALSQSETRLRFMADSMPQLVWITRPDGYHEYYNNQWYDYTGTEPGSTDGDGWNNLFHPDDQARARKRWQHSLKTGEPYEIEYRLYNKATDSYRWVIGRALPYRDENGEISKWYGTCTDIDDQKRVSDVQAFLADISKQLAMTLDINKTLKVIAKKAVPVLGDWCSIEFLNDEKGAIDQVAISHKDPKKIAVAKEYRRVYPVTPDRPTGVPNVIRTGKPEMYPVITEEMVRASTKDKAALKYLLEVKICSFMIVPLFIKNRPVGAMSFVCSESMRHFGDEDLRIAEDLASRVSAFLTNATLFNESIEDIAKRKKLEEQLKEEKANLEMRVRERTSQLQLTNVGLRDEIRKRRVVENELQASSMELKRSNQELQDFAYVSSHDLQEPLRKIRAFGDLLKTEHASELGDGAEYLERMLNAASRMSTLIEDLLTFSRVATKPMELKSVDLNRIVKEVVYDLETRVRDTKADVTIGELPHVFADEIYMRQLLQNLIGNALKFHKPNKSPIVSIEGGTEGDWVELRIHDEGIGFDEKYLDRIFAVFQRLHARDAYEGTGIGLAVCRRIVERYGGTITATSKKGHGTTFIVRLPAGKGRK